MEHSYEQGLLAIFPPHKAKQKEHREARLAYKLSANSKLGFISCIEFKNFCLNRNLIKKKKLCQKVYHSKTNSILLGGAL